MVLTKCYYELTLLPVAQQAPSHTCTPTTSLNRKFQAKLAKKQKQGFYLLLRCRLFFKSKDNKNYCT